MRGLSLVAASRDHSSSRCAGLSPSRPLLLRSTGSRRAGSVTVAHGPSCSAACGIFPDQGSNPCPPHWQADSQPLRHQGSPEIVFLRKKFWFSFLVLLLIISEAPVWLLKLTMLQVLLSEKWNKNVIPADGESCCSTHQENQSKIKPNHMERKKRNFLKQLSCTKENQNHNYKLFIEQHCTPKLRGCNQSCT